MQYTGGLSWPRISWVFVVVVVVVLFFVVVFCLAFWLRLRCIFATLRKQIRNQQQQQKRNKKVGRGAGGGGRKTSKCVHGQKCLSL